MTVRNLPGFKYLRNNVGVSYLVIIILAFILGTVISIVNWRYTETRSNNTLITRYDQELNQSKLIINSSLNQYSLLLDDGTSLLAVNDNSITQTQWLNFFQTYSLTNKYPGVDAVSFAQYVPVSDLPNYLSNLANQGRANFVITPAGNRSVYAPVTDIGYISPTSLSAMGFDELSNPIRAKAVNEALDSGQIAMSGKISLIAVNKGQPAFIIYKPVYSGSSSTLAERQSSIYGFVFIAVNAQEFFSSLLSQYTGPGVAIQIYDNSFKPSDLYYETPNYNKAIHDISAPIESRVNVMYGGRNWDIKVVIAKSSLLSGIGQPATPDLLLGLGLSLLISLILWYFTYYRVRKIFWQNQQEVAFAKDELLSLASHQLRTPATIVKQYLGILLQDYGGSVTRQQRRIIKTAYDSNEKQLEIANQFLNAARLGSGRIVLSKEAVEVGELIQEVVSEQRKIAKSRQQRIIYVKPKRAYRLESDPKYLPMVFENLLTNAIKYSKRRTKITVSVRRSGQEVLVGVRDQGMGISEEELLIVFDKFSHASNEKDTDVGGTGIGLYLAKLIADMHGGSITVKSTVGKGSEFTVHLPIEPKKAGKRK
ncbi:MAG TPA: CHASE domain-containing protein [Candidatus Saccharimonadales bacterium]|jgi:signal transduction histidine kinase